MVWSIIIIVLLASADQLLKLVVKVNIDPAASVTVIDGFFYLVNRRNTGAAWSFLAGQDWGVYALAGVSAIVTVVLLVIIWRSNHVKLQSCLTIITAGSIGNLIDRVRDQAVTDYLDFHFGSYVFPTFNLADMLIVIGTVLLALLILTDSSIIDNAGVMSKEKPHDTDHSNQS